MFFDIFSELCKKAGKKPSAVAAELGINKSNVSNWKKNGYTPRGELLQRISEYFGVSVDYLLGKGEEKTPAGSGERVSDDDIKFALFGTTDIDDDLFEDVKALARTAAEQAEKRKSRK